MRKHNIKGLENKENPLVCDDCGKRSDDVKETYCPFDWEMYGEKNEMKLCDECYFKRSDEV